VAILVSDQLTLEIKNIVQLDTEETPDLYERFDISITIRQQPVYSNQVLGNTYELVSSNISSLINAINNVLYYDREVHLETLEPDFEFVIKRILDVKEDDLTRYLYPEQLKENQFEFVIWISSGNWNGFYSHTSVGARFMIDESDLIQFYRQLSYDYENRTIQKYEAE
jgi:hypothetical protein